MNTKTVPQGKPQKGEEVTLSESSEGVSEGQQAAVQIRGPHELRLTRAHEFNGDLRKLPKTPPLKMERPEKEGPEFEPLFLGPPPPTLFRPAVPSLAPFAPAVAAPTPLLAFDGLDFNTWGGGHPPDTNGDVGPNHYIETVNTSIGIFNKTTGAQITAFTFNTLMSQGAFGNLCDTNNFGDPVVLYDTFEDRWVITDFAFTIGGGGNIANPPGSFQCFAVSKTGDPVVGGWDFYSIAITDALNDYPKFGIWPDALYMTSNMFGFGATSGSFIFSREWAFNKAQMYAGAANPQIVTFDAPKIDQNGGTVFTIIPSNARLQSGTPPAGTPNYFVGTGTYTNALAIWKFHVDFSNVFLSTFTGVTTSIAGTSWAAPPPTVPSLGGNNLDTLATRSMMQNQYTNSAGIESLWDTHTVQGSAVGLAGVRWYQTDVTGGTIAAAPTQVSTHSPDANFHRFMPSLAIDHAGDMMLGYSVSSSTTKPAIRYAGRLSGDALSSLPQTEVDLIQGTGTQLGNCGGAPCTRWGDYSAMTLDPVDGCTFWYTNEYYATDGLDDLTRIGSFKFPGCTAIGNGTVSGTVTASPGGAPISGATVAFGSRTMTTAVNGTYSFTNIPAGTYPSIAASDQGFNSVTSTPVVVPSGGTSTNDFALSAAAGNACLTDTSQADFSVGRPTSCDLTTSAGDVTLSRRNLDQINEAVGGNGVGITITTWGGQTFTPSVTGQLTQADINLFCSGCTGTTPNLTLSVRATSAGLPTGADLASATITGFSSNTAIFYTADFVSPATLTAGTQYGLAIRPTANPSAGTYALTRTGAAATGADIYAGGTRVSGATSGTVWSIPLTGGITTDTGFRTFMTTPSGTFVSSLKDSNPAAGNFPHWTRFSWTATTPANTNLKFQVAGSNNPAGPFNFVGTDGTGATFYTSTPASLFQFNNLRYLKYKAFLSTTDNTVTPTLSDVSVCFTDTASPTAAPARISGNITSADGVPLPGVTVLLNGAASATAIADGNGGYHFDNVETDNFYTVTPSLANYHFTPANRSFSLVANKTDAVFTAFPDAVLSANAIDTNEYFVRQQYLDFLGREPDQGGLAFWTGKLNQCNSEGGCLSRQRVEVSAAFFGSREFQETGSYVYRLYKGALGRQLSYNEFASDRQQVIGGANLETSKAVFASVFVLRPEFVQRYQTNPTGESFVDAVLQTLRDSAGIDLASERTNLINRYNSGGTPEQSRGLVVRAVAEDATFSSALYNPSFVLMEYFGYLRRGAEPDGYAFWLNVLNTSELQNYRGMVCSFLTSTEYQRRFGAVITRTNAECER